MLCALVCGILIATAIGAVILRTACSLFNKMAQPENQVPEPEFGKAMLMAFISSVVNGVAGLVIGGAMSAANLPPNQTNILSQALSLPLTLLALAVTVTLILPTTFGRGLLISLLYLVVAVLVGIAIIAIVFGVMIAFAAVG